mgnify:CR=1 FL=1
MKHCLARLVLLFASSCLIAADRGYPDLYRKTVAALPGTPTALFDTSDPSQLVPLAKEDDALFSIADTADQPFAKAARVDVKRQTHPAWKVQLTTQPSLRPVKKGDVLFIALSVRCVASDAETGGGQLFVTLQQTKTYDTLTSLNASPGKEWMRLYLRAVADRDYPAQNLECVFHLGACKQTLECGGFIAVNLGPGVDLKQLPFTHITYAGQAADAPWRQKALTRIENSRKGDLAVQVVDAEDKPVTNATVHVQMTRHAYQFGTFVENIVLRETGDGKKYRETVKRLFNRVTCPIYWNDWGWQNPETRLRYIAIAQWAKENGFYTRGHNLIWPGWRWMPKEMEALRNNPAELKNAIHAHLSDVATTLRPIGFDTYDVVNEPRSNHDVEDLLGPKETVNWYKLVHTIDPRPALGINEFAIVSGGGDTVKEQDLYMKQIRALLDAGAPLSVIGVQCHMGENLTPPQKVLEILDRLATLKLPIHATEFDIATDDEQTQADYMRDFLIAFFSHPATESITQWGFWEGCHWIPRAALFAKDWRIKPSGQAYIDLVLGAWWTNETHTTDRQGYCRIRAFLGDHTVTVTYPDGHTFTRAIRIAHDGTTLTLKQP